MPHLRASDNCPTDRSSRRVARIRRRDLFALLGGTAAVWPFAAHAQQRGAPFRVGILTPADDDRALVFEAFRRGLREHGYEVDHNIALEYRFSHGDLSIFPRLAAELVGLPVDLILTEGGGVVARAAMGATRTIPIVFAAEGDPVAERLVASLPRPDGNVTGTSLGSPELGPKRLQLLKSMSPDLGSVVVLANPASEEAQGSESAAAAAAPLGLIARTLAVTSPQALARLTPADFRDPAGGPSLLMVSPDAVFWNHRVEIVALAAAARATALYSEREYVDAGGLMSYGPNVPDVFRRTAGYVARILNGAKPADLPVQQPTKFELVVNLKTAQALGLTIPPFILAGADEVIE
jgi:putative ABC transport system substrate-binding protein